MVTRLLAAARGGGGFADVGYSMSADEIAFWQDQAALLDPDAYEWVEGTSITRTVPGDEHWYLVSGWYLQATGGGSSFFHRERGVFNPLPLPAGRSITTDASLAGSAMYLCKPALVVDADSRYTGDPRALYFNRIQRIAAELDQFTIGDLITDNSQPDVAFPADFTDGLVVHLAVHDLAWAILRHDGNGGPILQPEISDADPIRLANTVILPFKRTTFPNVTAQGASSAQGRYTLTYLKLPVDW